MTEQKHEGWSNYETWAVALWLDTDAKLSWYWREQAANHERTAPHCQMVSDGVWTAEDAPAFSLAEQLKEEITDNAPNVFTGAYSDLLNAALNDVNWHEIAQHYLLKAQESPDLFGPVISAYSRTQAIADGVLVDVSEMAREAGVTIPTALTHAVWAEYVHVSEGIEGQDESGRLWDILMMFRFAAKQSPKQDTLLFDLFVRNDNQSAKRVTLKAICGPGDTPEPVLTILLPDED